MGENEEQQVEQEEAQKKQLVVREGDIFTRANGTIDCVITRASNLTSTGMFFRVRMLATTIEPFDINEAELLNYINQNELQKLDTIRDQIENLDMSFVLNEGDVFTKNGETFIEILSNEVPFLNAIGEFTYMVGVKDEKGVSYRNSIYIKSLILGGTDQYPASLFSDEKQIEKQTENN